jgi:pyridoxamine-phosphate oxidase
MTIEADDPIALLREWLDDAVARGAREPYAMTLATADAAGMPSSRTVMLHTLRPDGLVFTTHASSRKGAELAARPYAAATFFWRETLRQVNVAGPVRRLPDAESDTLFAGRPPAAQAVAAASRQSATLHDEDALRERAAALLAAGGPIPRPGDWAAYHLGPTAVEVWQGSADRLHFRLRYERAGGGWARRRLQP